MKRLLNIPLLSVVSFSFLLAHPPPSSARTSLDQHVFEHAAPCLSGVTREVWGATGQPAIGSVKAWAQAGQMGHWYLLSKNSFIRP